MAAIYLACAMVVMGWFDWKWRHVPIWSIGLVLLGCLVQIAEHLVPSALFLGGTFILLRLFRSSLGSADYVVLPFLSAAWPVTGLIITGLSLLAAAYHVRVRKQAAPVLTYSMILSLGVLFL